MISTSTLCPQKKHVRELFAPSRPEEVLKFNNTCVSWNPEKTDPVTNFLNPENRSFENVSIATFK